MEKKWFKCLSLSSSLCLEKELKLIPSALEMRTTVLLGKSQGKVRDSFMKDLQLLLLSLEH